MAAVDGSTGWEEMVDLVENLEYLVKKQLVVGVAAAAGLQQM